MIVSTVVSMRKSALRVYGGPMLNLYNSPRFDHAVTRGHRSRDAGTACRKDYRTNGQKNYRPWQRLKAA